MLSLKFVIGTADRAEGSNAGSKAQPVTTLFLPTMELLLMEIYIYSNMVTEGDCFI